MYLIDLFILFLEIIAEHSGRQENKCLVKEKWEKCESTRLSTVKGAEGDRERGRKKSMHNFKKEMLKTL